MTAWEEMIFKMYSATWTFAATPKVLIIFERKLVLLQMFLLIWNSLRQSGLGTQSVTINMSH
jgi:hypothetical protein